MPASPRRAAWRAAFTVLLSAGLAVAARGARRPDRPPLAHTGGFGEPTCRACHSGDLPDAADEALRIEGLPDRYVPGRSYPIAVLLRRAELVTAGFEAAIRFDSGRQAGQLVASDSQRVMVERDSVRGVVYAHHTRRGTAVEAGTARWTFTWVAPADGGRASLHVAAVASNDDNSNLGDVVYTATGASQRR